MVLAFVTSRRDLIAQRGLGSKLAPLPPYRWVLSAGCYLTFTRPSPPSRCSIESRRSVSFLIRIILHAGLDGDILGDRRASSDDLFSRPVQRSTSTQQDGLSGQASTPEQPGRLLPSWGGLAPSPHEHSKRAQVSPDALPTNTGLAHHSSASPGKPKLP